MSYPADPEFSAINLQSVHKNYVTEARSGRRQVRSIGAQQWKFTAGYNNLTRNEFMPVYAFCVSQEGQLGEFSVTPPVISSSRGNPSGNMLTAGIHDIGENSVLVDGFNGTIKAGDFIKFNNHDKVYMVKSDRTQAGALLIEPRLREAVADNTLVIYNNVPFKMRLDNDVQEFELSGYDRYQFEVDLIEAI